MSRKRGPPLSLSAWQLIQAMRDGVVVTDPNGTIRAVNRAFCAVTGYARREVLGGNPKMLRSGRHGRAFYARMWSSILRRGFWQGEIWNRRKSGDVYPEWLTISAVKDERGRARCYLGVFRDITFPKLDEERLKRQAQHDPLTGLANRRLLTDRLRRALARRSGGRRLALLFLDVDHFKDVNDRLGHAAGDAFLQAAAGRLRGCVRRTDTVARWAGDEFVVLLQPVALRADVERVAEKILKVLKRPFRIDGRRVRVSASVGACLSGGGAGPNRLLDRADEAMYEAKKRGRDGLRFWSRAVSLRRRWATPQRGASAKAAPSDRKAPQARTGMGSMRRRSGVRKGPSGS